MSPFPRTGSAAQDWSMVMVGFKPASGGSSTTTVNYVLTDHLGGTNVILDSSGSAVNELLDYVPYGGTRLDEVSGITSEPRKFSDYERDSSTGLDYVGSRYYSSGNGKFLSQDPAFLAVGDNSQIKQLTKKKLQEYLSDPQGLNSYGYARNNPLRYNDPNGEWFEEALSWINAKTGIGPAVENNSAYNYATTHKGVPYTIAAGSTVLLGGAGVLYGLSAAGVTSIGTTCLAFCGQVANEAQQVSTFNSAVGVFKNADGTWLGQAGNSAGNRIITGTVQEAQTAFNQATQGYVSQNTYENGQVVVRYLQDGTKITYRTLSSSGAQATIQIANNQGGPVQTLKYMAEGATK